MMRTVFALVVAAGCSTSSESVTKKDLEGQAQHANDCCKIEGSEIGQEDTLIRLGSRTVLVHDWVAKTGANGEYAGFSLTIAGASSINYVVKASGELHPSNATTWIHPNGAGGGSATPGISNVDFCEECDDPDGCEGGGGGGGGGDDDGECDNPDGCDGGGGGGGGDTDPVLTFQ